MKTEAVSINVRCTIIAVSYRGYWTSRGRPSQKGLELDAAAALKWIDEQYEGLAKAGKLRLVLWGQSIGTGVATTAAATRSVDCNTSPSLSRPCAPPDKPREGIPADGMILETPFTSVQDMLVALYPQRWLPYRYLWPFLRSRWDNRAAFRTLSRTMQNSDENTASSSSLPSILILQAGQDELVPAGHGLELESLCTQLGFRTRRIVIGGALHNEVMSRSYGRNAAVQYLLDQW